MVLYKNMVREVIYYTNNICDEKILNTVIRRLNKICKEKNLNIISVSHKPMDFGKNVVMDLPSSAGSIFKQIYRGLQESVADIVYLVEHDVLYHEGHFNAIPRRPHHFLYNQNIWQVDRTGQAIYHKSRRTSQLIVYRKTLMEYLEVILIKINKKGYFDGVGIAPMTHPYKGIQFRGLRTFNSEIPNIDIRHESNFSNYEYKEGDTISDEIPWWGKTLGRFNELLEHD